MKNRIPEWLWSGGVPWGLCLCALLCGGCLSAAYGEYGTEAVVDGRLVDDGYVEAGLGGSVLPLHWSSAEVGRSLTSALGEPVEVITNSGWRIGALFLMGDAMEDDPTRDPPYVGMRNDLKLSDDMLFAWGYQFQIQHGMAGSTVGLIDIIPLLMGLDESLLIPAINVLVGLRFPNNIEFAIGPHFSPRAYLDPYFKDDVHLEGLGIAAAIGYWYRNPGGVNMSVDLSFMMSGDLTAVGLTFGWNFAD